MPFSSTNPSHFLSKLFQCALIGSVFGALGAKLFLASQTIQPEYRLILDSAHWLRQLPLAVLFPMTLMLADFSQERGAFFFAFFGRGAAVSYLICVCLSVLQADGIRSLLGALLVRCLVPLPVCFFVSEQLMRSEPARQGRRRLFWILILFSAEAVGFFLEHMLLH